VGTRSRVVSGTAQHEERGEDELGGERIGSTAIDGKSGGTEQVLKGPAASQVEADAAGGLAYAGADFEELGAQGFDLGGVRERSPE
jgi:hypothetical protein